MKILKTAVGNSEEAYIEKSFTSGINIIFSGDNNKGKTIVLQSMMYALGNKPIFPDSFEHKKYFHYVEFEHYGKYYSIVRVGDSFVVGAGDGIRMFDSLSEFKRFWNAAVFPLPQIILNGSKKIVDMELYVQIFFVGQDSRDTSNIFNAGYYHKDDFKNMITSYAGEFDSEISADEGRSIREQIKKLSEQRREQINLHEFYKTSAVATEYLSRIKDQNAFQERVAQMDAINEQIAEIRKLRSRAAARKSSWSSTLKELRSLNRTIEVGELRCMDCNSTHIAYKGTGKVTYSFDVSTQEMRDQIISSIQERIASYDEEIEKHDFDISELQKEFQELMRDDEVTIENIVAYKQGFHSAEEIEAALTELDRQISELNERLNKGIQDTEDANQKRGEYHNRILMRMNQIRTLIDPDSISPYSDLFTKRGAVVSGSEETVFYISKLVSVAEITQHFCPIIIDSFRAEDLSTEKEKRVIELIRGLSKQSILTTTLKAEEQGKYEAMEGITAIDYSSHQSSKLLNPSYVPEFEQMLGVLHLQI